MPVYLRSFATLYQLRLRLCHFSARLLDPCVFSIAFFA